MTGEKTHWMSSTRVWTGHRKESINFKYNNKNYSGICIYSLSFLMQVEIFLVIFWMSDFQLYHGHHFANKGLYSQSYGFSSSHVQMGVGP